MRELFAYGLALLSRIRVLHLNPIILKTIKYTDEKIYIKLNTSSKIDTELKRKKCINI